MTRQHRHRGGLRCVPEADLGVRPPRGQQGPVPAEGQGVHLADVALEDRGRRLRVRVEQGDAAVPGPGRDPLAARGQGQAEHRLALEPELADAPQQSLPVDEEDHPAPGAGHGRGPTLRGDGRDERADPHRPAVRDGLAEGDVPRCGRPRVGHPRARPAGQAEGEREGARRGAGRQGKGPDVPEPGRTPRVLDDQVLARLVVGQAPDRPAVPLIVMEEQGDRFGRLPAAAPSAARRRHGRPWTGRSSVRSCFYFYPPVLGYKLDGTTWLRGRNSIGPLTLLVSQ